MLRSVRIRRGAVAAGVCLTSVAASREAGAWVFPEHTRITATAMVRLERQTDPDAKRRFRETMDIVEKSFGTCEKRDCVSFATLPSLAADHSCTPSELMTRVTRVNEKDESWVLEVLRIGREAGETLVNAGS